jgi:hypothetical protein
MVYIADSLVTSQKICLTNYINSGNTPTSSEKRNLRYPFLAFASFARTAPRQNSKNRLCEVSRSRGNTKRYLHFNLAMPVERAGREGTAKYFLANRKVRLQSSSQPPWGLVQCISSVGIRATPTFAQVISSENSPRDSVLVIP